MTTFDHDTKQALIAQCDRGDELFLRMLDHLEAAYLLHERFKRIVEEGDAEAAYAAVVAVGAALRPLAAMLQGMENFNVES